LIVRQSLRRLGKNYTRWALPQYGQQQQQQQDMKTVKDKDDVKHGKHVESVPSKVLLPSAPTSDQSGGIPTTTMTRRHENMNNKREDKTSNKQKSNHNQTETLSSSYVPLPEIIIPVKPCVEHFISNRMGRTSPGDHAQDVEMEDVNHNCTDSSTSTLMNNNNTTSVPFPMIDKMETVASVVLENESSYTNKGTLLSEVTAQEINTGELLDEKFEKSEKTEKNNNNNNNNSGVSKTLKSEQLLNNAYRLNRDILMLFPGLQGNYLQMFLTTPLHEAYPASNLSEMTIATIAEMTEQEQTQLTNVLLVLQNVQQRRASVFKK
jgi:hypothetical protein